MSNSTLSILFAILIYAGSHPSVVHAQSADTIRRLEEVVINTEHKKYKTDTVSTITRTQTPLLQTPQSIQVISQQTILDLQASTLNELSSVMTGVKANSGMGSFSMRGFTGYYPFGSGFITFNGVRGNLYLWSQQPLLYNVQQVEVLRGPAAVLFSEGAPGGVINFTTKKPLPAKQLQLTASYGSWNSKRFSADMTGPLSKDRKWLYRAIAGYDQGNSFRDYQDVRNLLLAPSLTYLINDKSKLDLEVNYAYAKAVQQYDRGTYVYTRPDGSFDFNYYPDNLTIQSPSDYGKTHNTSVTLTYENKLSKDLRLSVIQRYIRSKFDYTDHIVSGIIRNDSISRGYQDWLYDQYNWQTTGFLEYKIKTGVLQHQVLGGVDYNNYGWYKNDYRNSVATRISIFNPDYSLDPPAANPEKDYYDDNKQRISLIGSYIQDQISYKNLTLLLSVRYDSYDLVRTPLSARDSEQGNQSKTDAWIPRAGLVYAIQKNLTVYSSYTKSFTPQNSNSVKNGGPFPPRIATQYEVGAKGSVWQDRISLMLAAYNIDYTNILAAAPTDDNPNHQVAIDGTRSKGIEATVQGSIQNFSLIAGYAYNDHVLTADNTLGTKGSRFQNAPKHLANLWLKYNVPSGMAKGLGVGVGGRYMSDQLGFQSNPKFIIPSSKVYDAMINYDRNNWGLQLNFYNISNERYFIGGNSRTVTASLGNPFNFRIGMNYTIR
ncbi:TonB-dependent siderophore receptor [Sphingobacterium spiritivorum]|uniref:TonB-dependent siderophore receptor n=1 Tax=Sphingobacterium spiritivorum TaxID=258 RepID=UPI00367C41BF